MMNDPASVIVRGPRPPSGTQAVVRAIHLLKTVSQSSHPLSLDDLSNELGLSKPTAHRILSALISEGMVRQDPATRCFAPGPESLALSANAIRQHDLRSLARPVLEKLVLQYGETATLEIRVGSEMLILDEVVSSQLVGAQAEIGTRWPIYATSSGKIALSTLSPTEISAYLKLARQALTDRTLVSKKKLLDELDRAQKDGYAIVEGELQMGFSAVSAAIGDENGRALATLSIGGPGDRLNRSTLRRLGSVLCEEAQELERPGRVMAG
ncbi:MAG: IclR family transcriptional regulator [Bacteroidetes bacterium]|nr:IclR family transcriptional regulator [Bacteroidota bacterium]